MISNVYVRVYVYSLNVIGDENKPGCNINK